MPPPRAIVRGLLSRRLGRAGLRPEQLIEQLSRYRVVTLDYVGAMQEVIRRRDPTAVRDFGQTFGTPASSTYWFRRIEAMIPVEIATSRKSPSTCTQ